MIPYLFCSRCYRRLTPPYVTVHGTWKGRSGVKYLCRECAEVGR